MTELQPYAHIAQTLWAVPCTAQDAPTPAGAEAGSDGPIDGGLMLMHAVTAMSQWRLHVEAYDY